MRGKLKKSWTVIDAVTGARATMSIQNRSRFEAALQKRQGWVLRDGLFHAPSHLTPKSIPDNVPLGVPLQSWTFHDVSSDTTLTVIAPHNTGGRKRAQIHAERQGWRRVKRQWRTS